ncbi:MAG: dihydrolipoamide acetyltransferase family protein [Acidimicrobiia bacterium]
MAREFRLPDIGEGLTEAEIVRWLVDVGEEVREDQPIVEVETDKAVVEIPSPFAGVVISHGGAEGDVIEVGAVLVTIGEPGEPAAPAVAEAEPSPAPPIPESRPEPEPIVGTLSEEAEVLTSTAVSEPQAPAAIKALPVVRKLARDNDIDIETVVGTGPGGRITRADVEAVVESRGAAVASAVGGQGDTEPVPEHAVREVAVGAGHGISDEEYPEVESEPEPEPEPEREPEPEPETQPLEVEAAPGAEPSASRQDERRHMSRLRRTIAANMERSWAEIPHVTTFDDVDATRLLEVRRALSDRHGYKIPIEALVIKAVLPAIDEFPEFNASIDGDDLVLHGARDIGIAVDTPDGLLVAVIRDADQKSVLDLAGEIRRLGEGARDRSLRPDELTGQTFTVSNIGAVGGGHGTPIVPYGTVAILSVGMARLRPIVYEEDLAIAPVMPLSISYDHRVIDGAVGRRFMSLVIENLEEPALFLAG